MLTCLLRSSADFPPVRWQSQERCRESSPHYHSIPGVCWPKQPRICVVLKVCTQPCGCRHTWVFVFDVGCSHGCLQPEKGAACPHLASLAISQEEVVSSASSPLWLPMLGPLGDRGGYLTAVLVSTSCLVKSSILSEWQFSTVPAHWPLLSWLHGSDTEEPT